VHILEQSRKMLSICESCKSRSAVVSLKINKRTPGLTAMRSIIRRCFYGVSELAITKAPDVHRTSASATVY
jgi:hypothetical protein